MMESGYWLPIQSILVIEHNELYNLPYSGISIGWGWGRVDVDQNGNPTPTAARNNQVKFNKIHRVMQVLLDGSTIYMMSDQKGTLVSYNNLNIDKKCVRLRPGIQNDAGSANITYEHNIVRGGSHFITVNPRSHNLVYRNNFTNDNMVSMRGIYNNIHFSNNLSINSSKEDEMYNYILKNSGLEQEYEKLNQK